MSMQNLWPDQAVHPDAWIPLCTECAQKMRIVMATPGQEGREIRTYECACGRSERINTSVV
jgi:hypothetical protein